MVEKVVIKKEAYDDLIRLANKYAPKIICGFLVGRKDGETIHIDEVREAITRTSRRFHFKPNWHNYSYVNSKIEEEGKDVVGEFHSHPNGSEQLNLNDKKILRTLGGGFWIIVTLEKVIPWFFRPIDEFKDDQRIVPFETKPEF